MGFKKTKVKARKNLAICGLLVLVVICFSVFVHNVGNMDVMSLLNCCILKEKGVEHITPILVRPVVPLDYLLFLDFFILLLLMLARRFLRKIDFVFIHNPIGELFSKGILHPKIYE